MPEAMARTLRPLLAVLVNARPAGMVHLGVPVVRPSKESLQPALLTKMVRVTTPSKRSQLASKLSKSVSVAVG